MFRRIKTGGWSLVVALAAVGGVGYVAAQESAESTVDVVRVQAVGEPNEPEAMTPGAKKEAAASAVASASSSCSAQSRALQSAKRDKDIIRATCLDDKLGQCNANLQNMKRRQTALDEAIAAGDMGRANHELTVIGVMSQKFKMLAQAANQCVGQDLFDTGDTTTRSEVDLFAPDADPAAVAETPDWPIPFIPPPVSGVN